MSDDYLKLIWSKYTISPDPLSGMQSLHQACKRFTNHILQPSYITLSGGGFTLHQELAKPLLEIARALDHLLLRAAQHHHFSGAPSIGQRDVDILRSSTALHACATLNQIMLSWVTLVDRLAEAMCELKYLCLGDPLHLSRRAWPTRIPQILASLPPLLRVKLPRAFLEAHSIMVLPAPKSSTCLPHLFRRCSSANTTVDVKIIRAPFPPPSFVATPELPSMDQSTVGRRETEVVIDGVRYTWHKIPWEECPWCTADALETSSTSPALSSPPGIASTEKLKRPVACSAPAQAAELAETQTAPSVNRAVPLLTEDLSPSILSTTSTSTCVERREDNRGSVHTLVAAIEARERLRSVVSCPRPPAPRITLRKLVSPTSFQSSGPANPVVNPTVVKLGGLHEEPSRQAELLASTKETSPLTSLVDEATTAGSACVSRIIPKLRIADVRSESRSRDHAVKDTIDGTPSLEVLKFPAPAVVKNEAIERGGLKRSHQQVGIPNLDKRASDNLSSASTGSNLPALQSSAPVLASESAVELGGLKELCQRFGLPFLETYTSLGSASTENNRLAIESPAPALVNASAVELGGLETSHQQRAGSDLEIRTSGKSTHTNSSAPPLDAPVTMCNAVFTSPAPALAVELGGLEDLNQEFVISDSETRTLCKHSGISNEDEPLVLPVPALPSSAGSPASALISDGATVELGGPQKILPPWNEQLVKSETTSILTGNTHTSFASHSPSVLLSASATGVFALVSAKIRISWISYPRHPLFGEVAPDIEWEHEGIGTCAACNLAGVGARDTHLN
ncbi:hypothetical protein B0H17DRAFT_1195152 [Mycena rosella]|uniref:Uncharacterized protein n=1 Tax=Mycena rosella TaxID=1033263 RepID=A0AAD7DZN2_MYCRO|nr:hypothetical protein B0H17DRAFT_1195152 [Mycena rosella]